MLRRIAMGNEKFMQGFENKTGDKLFTKA